VETSKTETWELQQVVYWGNMPKHCCADENAISSEKAPRCITLSIR
jgi:hypothetical protein